MMNNSVFGYNPKHKEGKHELEYDTIADIINGEDEDGLIQEKKQTRR